MALAAALLPLVAFGAFGWLSVATPSERVGMLTGAREEALATPAAAGEVDAVVVGAPTGGGAVLGEMVVVSAGGIGPACAVGAGAVGANGCTGIVPGGVAATRAGAADAAKVGALATAPLPGAAWEPTPTSTDMKFAATAADPADAAGAVVELLFVAALGGA